jgi:serine/threonine-protein kinase
VQAEPDPYLAGAVIGDRYRLERELGRGGMGVVWVAHSLVLGIDVAVKLIRAGTGGAGLGTRMAREAHAAARLGHPALVRVFDFGWTSKGDPFLVMELVQGETLASLIAREAPISAIRAVQTLLPIADGLRLAHDRSIVHRDIKPDNILLSRDTLGRNQPKLLDFGIAKVGPNVSEGNITQVGTVLGSPEYMSPEQALGVEEIDERADVWALSVVLYEMVTGKIPFQRANYNALMHAIINDPPKPTTEYGVADSTLWAVISRGLSKSRDQRWANMTEFGEALALWLYEHGIKEDLSGNSVRAVWLDSALSGVMVELAPSAAPARPRPSGYSTSSALPAVGVSGAPRTQRQLLASQPARSHTQALKPWAVGLASATVVFGLALAWGVSRAPAARPIPSAEPSANVSVPSPAKAAETLPASTPSAPAAAPSSQEPEPVRAAAAASRPSPKVSASIPSSNTAKRAAAKRATKASLNRDFGF